MTISNSVLSKIKTVEFKRFPDPNKLHQPMDAGLWALWLLQDHFGLDDNHFTAGEISEVLLKRKISFSDAEITRGFTRAKKKIHKEKSDEKGLSYMIMQPGIEYLAKLRGEGDIAVIFVDGKKQKTDYERFSNLVNSTKGEIKILDKFYSRYSLDLIQEFGKKRKISLLTSKITGDEDEAKFNLALRRFKTEYKNVEIKIHQREFELHDRYIITDDCFILLGRGLQDLSGKESFVIALRNGVSDDIKEMLNAKFDERWKKAPNLK